MRTLIFTMALATAITCSGGMSRIAYAAANTGDSPYAERLGDLVNQYRKARDARPLKVDAALSDLAHEHGVAMAKAGRLSHDGFPSRVRRSASAMCVENVGWNYRTPDAQLDAWQRSPAHNRNLLHPRVSRMGIGVRSNYVTFIACQ